MTTIADPNECPFCAIESETAETPLRDRVYVSAAWRVRAHRSALPGWTLVIPRRHIESLDQLDDNEASELGLILRDLTRIYVNELGALKSYVTQFAEGTRHAHFSLAPRMPDLPPDRIGARSAAYNAEDEPLSEAQRDAVALRLAAAWRPRADSSAQLASEPRQ